MKITVYAYLTACSVVLLYVLMEMLGYSAKEVADALAMLLLLGLPQLVLWRYVRRMLIRGV